MPAFTAILVHCLWSDGANVHCSQDFTIFNDVINNGFNIYPMLPLEILIKNRLYQNPKDNYFGKGMRPTLWECLKFNRKQLHLDVCKNDIEMAKFIQTMKIERNDLSKMLTDESLQNLNGPTESVNQLLVYANTLANAYENHDVNDRSENETVLCLYNPPPNTRFTRRYNKSCYKEEIDFVLACAKENKSMDLNQPIRNYRNGSKEVRTEWELIHEEMKKEFGFKPVDLAINDWLALQKDKPIKIRLNQMAKSIQDLNFDAFEGDLEKETKDTEGKLKKEIAEKLMKLSRIQEEKICLQTKKIPIDLVNENCFPEMAEILAEAERSNKCLDIFPVSDSDTDFDSWSDSWSSDV